MKRLATLALAVILISGCNAMKPNLEETGLFSKEIEKRIYTQAGPTKAPEIAASTPAPTPMITTEQEDVASQTASVPAEKTVPTAEPAPKTTATWLSSGPDKSAQEIVSHQEQDTSQPVEQPVENPVMIEWPYPAITCPPEPSLTAEPEWPYITAPEPPTYTPEPEPTEPPQEEPTPTPQPTPAVPADSVDPAPEPTEQPAEPTPEQPAEHPTGGYAECSCGAMLTPEEVLPHMKAHAMKGESHSYRAY